MARVQTGQKVGYVLFLILHSSAGRYTSWKEYPAPSYTPTGYFLASFGSVGTGVPLGSISSHFDLKLTRVVILGSHRTWIAALHRVVFIEIFVGEPSEAMPEFVYYHRFECGMSR